jgi:hypothetical protein
MPCFFFFRLPPLAGIPWGPRIRESEAMMASLSSGQTFVFEYLDLASFKTGYDCFSGKLAGFGIVY